MTAPGANVSIEVTGGTLRGGEVLVQGSKNAAQKVLPLTALVPAEYEIARVPDIADTHAIIDVLRHLGALVTFSDGTCLIDTRDLANQPVPRALTQPATGTFLFAGVLLARFGSSEVGLPGGDEIGARPVGLHLDLLRAVGTFADELEDSVTLRSPSLVGAPVKMPIPSTGALMSIVTAACLADGETVVERAPWDTDIEAAFVFLRMLGVGIACTAHADDRYVDVTITPRDRGAAAGRIHFELPADRNDAATWVIAGALAPEPVAIVGAPLSDLEPLIAVLEGTGCTISMEGSTATVTRPRELLSPVETITVGASPLLHSDWAQVLSVALSQCRGTSRIVDTMYDARTSHLEPLARMGMTVRRGEVTVPRGTLMFDPAAERAASIEIDGPTALRSTRAATRDVRGSMALLLAGSIAAGHTQIDSLDQLRRGYEHLEARLGRLGVECRVL